MMLVQPPSTSSIVCDSCGVTVELSSTSVSIVCNDLDGDVIKRQRICTSCRCSSGQETAFTPSKLHLINDDKNAHLLWSADTESDSSTIATVSTKDRSLKSDRFVSSQRSFPMKTTTVPTKTECINLSTCLSEVDTNEVVAGDSEKENRNNLNTVRKYIILLVIENPH